MFVFKTQTTHAALIYVDDVLLMGDDPCKIKEVKDNLQRQFNIKDLGPLK